ncbi:MAG TPA: glycosyltransferase family 4 protein [Bacteroidales bacterium]|nr:glycosyltransferase family 4 protein [Bacteroidales bacterium]
MKPVKILILTQYFPPETGAAQNRLSNLAIRLQRKGAEVSILTAMPNYPQMKIRDEYRGKCYSREETEGLIIHRAWLYVGTSKSIFPRLLNYFSFVLTSLFTGWFRLGKFDFIICESPPLFLGISAWCLAKFKGARLVFNVSDLWPESAEKLGLVTNRFLLKLSTRLEEFLYRNSFLITGQTRGIVSDISSRFPQKRVHWLKNGATFTINAEASIQEKQWRIQNGFHEDDFILLYAGILGHAQGLEVILSAADILKTETRIRFILIGSGPVRDQLHAMKEQMILPNVSFFETVPRTELLRVIAEVDAAIIPLKRIELFKGAIPSKIFETLLMKKPMLLGVEGEAKELFIDEGKAGLAFIPEDAADLASKILMLYNDPEMARIAGESGFEYIRKDFNWDNIADDLWDKLLPDISG